MNSATGWTELLEPDYVTSLRGLVAGPVLVPGEDGYDAEVASWNCAISPQPRIVVGATSTEDVAAAVGWAAWRGLGVAVQSTGHGAVSSVDDAVMITTRRMTAVSVDVAAGTATVAAGANWAQVAELAAPHGLAPLCGSSSKVGVMGFTLGGGANIMGRTFGFTADHVRRLELVTADGAVRHVDADNHSDLFWALRGGKGNFGIVTSMEVGLVPVVTVYGGGIYYAAEDVVDVLHTYRAWAETLPEEMTTSIALLRLPPIPALPEPLRGRYVAHLRVVFVGDAAKGAELLAPMRAVAPAVIDYVGEMPFAASDSIHQDPPGPLPGWERGVLLEELTADAIDQLLALNGPDVEVPIIMLELRHLGGAFARPAAVPNAVSGRSGGWSLLVIAPVAPGLEEAVPQLTNGVIAAMSPWVAEGALLNFIGRAHSVDDVRSSWAPADRARLLEIKSVYDPANTFRFGHAIGV